MPSTEQNYTEQQQNTLLQIAGLSILHGLKHRSALEVFSFQYEPALQQTRASFVTLEIDGQLRGCIGTLKANKPLIEDVASNAYSSAFNDPRFPPLRMNEFHELDIHISVLTAPEPFPVADEADLLQKLVPGKDGLILKDGYFQSTFLPSVWESLKTPKEFLYHLKQKAGLDANYWSDTIGFQRYHTISFGCHVSELTLEKAGV